MTAQTDIPIEERIKQLLDHLGIEKAHFAGREASDFGNLTTRYPEVISTLTMVCPRAISSEVFEPISSRFQVITGDQGRQAEAVIDIANELPGCVLSVQKDYFSPVWADVAAERGDAVAGALLGFSSRYSDCETKVLEAREGEHYGISYRSQGSGPPLILLPLVLAASQWEPIIPILSEKFCTITLGGAELGAISLLESRFRIAYFRIVRTLIDELDIQPGETVLDVGGGTGVNARSLAKRTQGRNPITSVDISPYFVREARALAQREGLLEAIEFHEGNAEALTYADSTFDVVMSVTAMEEVDANKMMSELVRVTKPGGKIGVIVRALDLPWLVNLPLSDAAMSKTRVALGVAEESGCADASLYNRFLQEGLNDVQMLPLIATYNFGKQLERFESGIRALLGEEEVKEWDEAIKKSKADGTFFIAQPFHCAVGTKPE